MLYYRNLQTANIGFMVSLNNILCTKMLLTSGGEQELSLVLESTTVKVPAGVVSSASTRPCNITPRNGVPKGENN